MVCICRLRCCSNLILAHFRVTIPAPPREAKRQKSWGNLLEEWGVMGSSLALEPAFLNAGLCCVQERESLTHFRGV